jgi:threonine dehydratase
MTQQKQNYYPNLKDITQAKLTLNPIVTATPLIKNINLSDRYLANIFLKREDLQIVRSYKLRGAYNKISGLTEEERQRGVVCASAGNHAQGVAYSCQKLGISGRYICQPLLPNRKLPR